MSIRFWRKSTKPMRGKRAGGLRIWSRLLPRIEELETRFTPAAPVVLSLDPATPLGAFTNATSAVYTIVFDQPVTGVDAADFTVTTTGPLTTGGKQISGSGAVYTLTIDGVAGNGALGVNLVDDNSIRNSAGLPLRPSSFSFSNQATFAGGAGASGVVTADFNGDGRVDIVTGNSTGSSISVLLANGDGTFRALTRAIPSDMASMTAGDVNGDGRPDLVASYENWATVSSSAVLLGNGDGTFKPPRRLTAVYTQRTVLADFNGDGKLDLAYGSRHDGFVAVHLGHGDGTFRPQATYASTLNATLAAADLNGDGRTDLVFGSRYGSATVRVLLGNGDGSFQPQRTYPAGSPYQLTVGDLNGDQRPDVLVLDSSTANTAKLNLYLGNGDGTLRPPLSFAADSNGSTGGLAIADVNRDGHADMVFGSTGFNAYLGNGDGTFQPRLSSSLPGWTGIAISDWNGDGRPDVALANSGSVSIAFGPRGDFVSALSAIDQSAPTVTIASQPPSLSPSSHAVFAFSGDDPAVAGVASGVHHFEASLDGGAFMPATSPLSLQNLADGGHSFRIRAVDRAGNVGPSTLVTWTIDSAHSPSVASIVRTAPSATITNESTLTYAVTFDRDVTGVDAADFVARATGILQTGSIAVTGSGATYRVTIAGIQGDGAIQLELVDNDTILNSVSGAPLGGPGAGNGGLISASTQVDQSSPSATIASGPASPSNSNAGTFLVSAIDPNVGGVSSGLDHVEYSLDGSSFRSSLATLSVDGLATGTHTVQVRGVDHVGNVGAAASFSWVVDLVAPFVQSIARSNPSTSMTNAGSVTFAVTFSEAVVNVDAADFALATSGLSGTAAIGVAPVSGNQYAVTVSGLSGNGPLGLNLVDNGSIRDQAGNPLTTANANVAFQSRMTSQVALYAGRVVVGDINGDGRPDLAVATSRESPTLSEVTILLGNGDGTFRKLPNGVETTPSAYALALGDVNGDGRLDLAVTNRLSESISIVLGNGNGTFRPQTTVAVGSGPRSVALADFNGDGLLDLAASSTTKFASVRLGNGDGTFRPLQTFSTGRYSSALVVRDMDGDGRLDLAVANQDDNSTGVLLGNGDGTFQPQTTFAAAPTPNQAHPNALAVGDVNADGKPDLVSVAMNMVHVRTSDGAGGFAAANTYTAGVRLRSISLADFNGDGKVDLALGTVNASGVSVLLGNGDGTFRPQQTFFAGYNAHKVAVGDFNGDGRPDIATSISGRSVSVLRNAGAGNFTGESYTIYQFPTTPLVSLSRGSGVYNGAPFAATSAAAVGVNGAVLASLGDASLEISYYSGTGVSGTPLPAPPTNAGTYTAVARWSSNNPDYLSAVSAPVTFTIAPKTVTIDNVTANDKVYNGTPAATLNVSAATLVGTVPGDAVNLSTANATAAFANANAGVNKSVSVSGFTIAGAQAANYQLVQPSLTASILLAATTTGLSLAPLSPQPLYTPLTLTATLSPTVTAGGKVQFKDGTVDLGAPQTVTLVGGVPTATLTISSLGLGAHDLKAVLAGTANYLGSASNVVSQVVTLGAPAVLSISRMAPSEQFVTSESVAYAVRFDQPVSGVDAADFLVVADSTVRFAAPIHVVGSGDSYTVTVNGIEGAGALRLDLIDNDSIVGNGQPLRGAGSGNGSYQGMPYSIGPNLLSVAPYAVAIARTSPTETFTTAPTLTFTITFSEPVLGVDIADFRVALAGSATGTLAQLTQVNPTTYTATITGAGGLGQVGLNLVDDGSIRDAEGTALINRVDLFRAPIAVPIGSIPEAIAGVDLNRDGRVDLVVSNRNSSDPGLPQQSVRVLLGNGDGTFKPQVVFTVPQSASRMNVADVNGDGILDILSFAPQSNWVSVLLGNGDGSFQAATTTAAVQPYALAVADMNGDGKPDLAVTVNGGNAVGIKLGNGDGTFKAETTFAANAFRSVAIADLNGDRKPDIVVGPASFLLGNGDGTFRPATPFYSDTGGFVLADLNHDSIADLVGNGFASVRLGGNGSFQPPPTSPGSLGWVALGDFNLDGITDIVSARSEYNATSNTGIAEVLLGNGDGTFGPRRSYAMGYAAVGVIAPDIDGDSRPDLVTIDSNYRNATIRLHNDGSFTGEAYFQNAPVAGSFPSLISLTTSAAPATNANSVVYTAVFNRPVTGVDVSDFTLSGTVAGTIGPVVNIDGSTYAVTVSNIAGFGPLGLNLIDDGTIRDAGNRMLWSSTPAFVQLPQLSLPTPPSGLATGDLNADGKMDIVTRNATGGIHAANVLLGNGDGTFRIAATIPLDRAPSFVLITDINGDGKPDVLISAFSYSTRALIVLLGRGDGTFQPRFDVTTDGTSYFDIGDINGDAKKDIVALTGSINSGPVALRLGNGDGTFQPISNLNATFTPSWLKLSDFNADGKFDLVSTNRANGTMGVWLGNGDGSFKPPMTFDVGPQATTVSSTGAAADLDADGKIDLVIANDGAALSVLRGNGDGTFKPRLSYSIGFGQSRSIAVADVNGDGRLDLIALGTDSISNNLVRVLLGNGDGTFMASTTFAPGAFPNQLAAADFNGDGRPDIAVALENSIGGLSVLLNGNGATSGQVIVIDPFSPLASITTQPPAISGGSATFGFTADDSTGGYSSGVHHLEYQLEGGAFTAASNPLTLSGLADGTHTLTVRAVDNAGNVGPAASKTWQVDATGPVAQLTATPPPVSGGSATFTFSASDPVVASVSSGVARIEYRLDGGSFLAAPGPVNLTNLANGNHTVTVRAVDAAGNVGAGIDFTWLVDISQPSLQSITRLSPTASPTSAAIVTFQVAFNKSVTGVDAADFAVALTGPTTGAPIIVAPVSGSVYNVTISDIAGGGIAALNLIDNGTIRDAFGAPLAAETTPTIESFSIDRIGPMTSILATPPRVTNLTSASVSFTAADPVVAGVGSGLHHIEYQLDGGGFNVASSPFRFGGLVAGNHTLQLRAIDNLGNVGDTASYSWTVDLSAAPTSTVLAATPNATTGGNLVTFTATISPSPGNAGTVTFTDAGEPLPGGSDVAVVNGVASFTTSALLPGFHPIAAIYSGAAGFAGGSSNTINFPVVAALPRVVSATPNGNIPGLAGSNSRVVSLVVAFDQPVQLDAHAIALSLHTGNVIYNGVPQPSGMGAAPASLNISTANNVTWIITFAGNTDAGLDGYNSLKDGVYDLTIDATKVHPLGIPALNMAANLTTTFHRLFGDTGAPTTPPSGTPNVDFEAVVNSGDNLAFRQAFNNPANYKALLDFNGDGVINSGDNLQFRNRFNKSLTWRV
jgi:hypothetical protein